MKSIGSTPPRPFDGRLICGGPGSYRARSGPYGLGDGLREREERLRRRGARLRDHDGLARIALHRDARVDGDLAQERDAQQLRGLRPAAVLEDLVAVAALRALVVAHVL